MYAEVRLDHIYLVAQSENAGTCEEYGRRAEVRVVRPTREDLVALRKAAPD